MARIVVVYSGGLDSFTLLNHSLELGHEVFPITFNYGQKHIKEVSYAEAFCKEKSKVKIYYMIQKFKLICHMKSNNLKLKT